MSLIESVKSVPSSMFHIEGPSGAREVWQQTQAQDSIWLRIQALSST